MSFCNWLRTKKMAFENENAIAKEYFYHHIKENRSFAHLVFFFDEIRYYIKFNKNDKFNYEKELGIFCDY